MRSFIASLAAACMLISACGGAAPGPTATSDPLAGRYKALGGGGALPVAQTLTKRFSELHPTVVWELSDIGSEPSILLTSRGEIDVGYISRDLKASESGLVSTLSLGATGTAVIVNVRNNVNSLTKEEVRKVFAGEITDWSALGGNVGKITVFIREKDAATRANFEAYFFDGKPGYSKDAVEIFEKAETLKAIASFEGGIGTATLSSDTLNDKTIKLLQIDGVSATKENLQSGAWKVRRPLYLVYHTNPAKVKPAIKEFLDFVRGPEGQKILSSS